MESFATKEGTLEYRNMMIEEGIAHKTHYRNFQGLYLSSLGIGTYLGDLDKSTDKKVTAAVTNSCNYGINVIDTAINYRRQKAERCVGEALRNLYNLGFSRSNFFVSTKIGYIPGDADKGLSSAEYISNVLIDNGIIEKDEIINENCISTTFLNHQLNESLKNLGLDTIDLLYLHNVAESQKEVLGEQQFYEKMQSAFVFLEQQRQKKKIQYYGISSWDSFFVDKDNPKYLLFSKLVNLAELSAKKAGNINHGFKFIMVPFNLKMKDMINSKNQNNDTLFNIARLNEVGIFTSVPLLQGKIIHSQENIACKNKFGFQSLAHSALHYVRNQGYPIIGPIVGQKDPEHVDENLKLLKYPTK